MIVATGSGSSCCQRAATTGRGPAYAPTTPSRSRLKNERLSNRLMNYQRHGDAAGFPGDFQHDFLAGAGLEGDGQLLERRGKVLHGYFDLAEILGLVLFVIESAPGQ